MTNVMKVTSAPKQDMKAQWRNRGITTLYSALDEGWVVNAKLQPFYSRK
jgi:hypothetical protein